MKGKVNFFLQYLLLVIGSMLVGISVGFVLIPLKLTTGGFSGIATILYYLLKLPPDIGLILLNIPIFLITWKVLGFKYGFRSMIGMLFCSLGIKVGEMMGSLTDDYMLAALFGGLLSGIGIALTYRAGGSTGGTDLIARLVHHFKPYMNMGEILLFVDGATIAILSFTFHSVEIALYSIVAAFVTTKLIDVILEGANYAKALFIITDKADEISVFLHAVVNKTATKISAIGTYSNTEKQVLLCVVNKKVIPTVKDGIKTIDPKAFTIVTTVTEAIGEGFKE